METEPIDENIGIWTPRHHSTLLVIHCRSLKQLEMIRGKLEDRFTQCKLALSVEKTKIVYCKDNNRNESWETTALAFDFLGYTFRPRLVRGKDKKFFVSFCPAISNKAAKNIRHTVKKVWKLKSRISMELKDLAASFNPAIQGWINYYSRFHGSALYSGVIDYLNTMLVKWAMQKFKNLRRRPTRAGIWLKQMQLQNPNLFAHWKFSMTGNDRLIRAV